MSTMEKSRVILIGYRGTGKSTVGRLLAGRLGVAFLDSDEVIEERYGSIAAMVAAHGWPFFRAREKEVLMELAEGGPAVIATGGGAVLHREVWGKFRASALVVWLKASADVLAGRLLQDARSASQRPSLTGADFCAEIEAVLAERTPLYQESAHFEVDTEALGVEAVVEEIVKRGQESGVRSQK